MQLKNFEVLLGLLNTLLPNSSPRFVRIDPSFQQYIGSRVSSQNEFRNHRIDFMHKSECLIWEGDLFIEKIAVGAVMQVSRPNYGILVILSVFVSLRADEAIGF